MAEVVTGEAVALDLPVANFPSRIAALLIDMAAQVLLILIISVVLAAAGPANADYLTAGLIALYVIVVVGYPTIWETLSRGKTPGKLALGLRVIGDDGSPERFRQALVRALVGALEIWTFVLAPVGLLTSLISERGKRVGDVFAGTHVIQERMPYRQALPPVFAMVPPPLAAWAQSVQVASLSDQTADAAGSYLRRFAELSPEARETVGVMLARAVSEQVTPPPPPGTPPAAYLSAVLAVRRERELARLAGTRSYGIPPATAPPIPADTGPADTGPADTGPADTRPADAAPAHTAPTDTVDPGVTTADVTASNAMAARDAPSIDRSGFAPPGTDFAPPG
jgi:uncharacterized RDD family membrane protein YckC